MSTTLLKHLANKIKEERTQITDDLARGLGKDFSDYKYAVGIVRGLDIVTTIIMETAERMGEEDSE